jgi:6-phosphogluconolactonase (cycloisomerase 2 family)
MRFIDVLTKFISVFISGLLLSSCSIVNDSFMWATSNGAPSNSFQSALVEIQVTPANVTVPLGKTQNFRGVAVFSDGSTSDVSTQCSWQAVPGTGTTAITSQGLVQTLGGTLGSVTVSANYLGVTGQAALTIAPPVLVSLAIAPGSSSIALGTTQSFTATGTYSDNSQSDLTNSVSWGITEGTGYATINSSSGLATSSGGSQGSVTVYASLGGVSGSTALRIGAPSLVSIAVTPSLPSVPLGNTQAFTATGTYTDGSNQNITSSVTWSATPVTGSATIGSTTGLANTSGGSQGTVTIKATSGATNGSTTLTVAPPLLVSIAVTPAAPSVALGNTQPFTATGTYSDGTHQNITTSVTWSAVNGTGAATIGSSTGLAVTSGGAVGTVTINAVLGSVGGSTTLTVTAATLVSLAVTPTNPSVALGNSQQFTATGTYSDGSHQNITSSVTWNATPVSGSATINGSGLASTLAGSQGTVTITASSGGINGSTTLTVAPIALTSISVTPANQGTPLGNTQQYTATGHYSDGSSANITGSVAWSVIPGSGAATINNLTGLLSTVGGTQGSITVQAVQGGITGSTSANVGAVVLSSITVAPTNPSIALGNTQQFTATGHYSDSSTQNITTSVTWSATNGTGSASIGSTTGLATTSGGSQGTVTITAVLGAINGNTTLTVLAPALLSISVTPSAPSVALGNSQQFTATGTYSDGSHQDITGSVAWSATNGTGSASINSSSGLASTSGGSQGTVTLTATSGAMSGNATLTVTAPLLVSIAVTPSTPSVPLGNTQQFTATGTYSDGSNQNITASVTWAATNGTGSATINNAGLASTSGGSQGNVTLTATQGSVSGSATLTVAAPALVSISVTPTTPSVPLGNTQQFTATGTYTDSTNHNLTASVAWSATNGTGSASINSSGLVTTSGGSQGTVTLTAVSGTLSGSTTLTVAAPILVSIAVTPTNPSVALGSTEQFTAAGTYSDGSNQNITLSVTWTAANGTGAATINSSGLASTVGGAQGTVTIEANLGPVNQSTTLTITAPVLTSLTLTPANPQVPLGHTEQFTATGTYSDGSNQNVTSSVTWTATNGTGAATINSSGLASTVGGSPGTITIKASLGSVNGTTILTVTSSGNEFVYVPNGGDNTISEFQFNPSTGALSLVGTPATGTATNWSVSTATPNGKYLYTLNQAGNSISGYSITTGTGALVPVAGSPFTGGGLNSSSVNVGYLTTALNGSYLYSPNQDGTISAFAINPSTGGLTPLSNSPYSAGLNITGPTAMVTSPNNKFLYVTDDGGTNLFVLSINPTSGALTPIQSIPVGSGPNNAVIDMTGTYLYVTAENAKTLSIYTINENTINNFAPLTAVSGSPFSLGSNKPEGMAITPNNQYLYMTTDSNSTINAFTISPSTGILTNFAITPGSFSAAFGLAVDPSGGFLFAPDYANAALNAYTIHSNGTITALSGSPFPTGNAPFWVTVTTDPSTAFPQITGVSPSSAQDTGGNTVVIAGSGFVAGATVYFGPNACTDVIVNSPNQISCTIPTGTDGSAILTVTNPNSLTGSSGGLFTYVNVTPQVTILNLHNHQLLETGFAYGTSQGVVNVGCQYDGGAVQVASGNLNWYCALPTGSQTWKQGSSHTITAGIYHAGTLSAPTSYTVIKGRNKDINGDGYPDLVIGAPDDYWRFPTIDGAVYVYYGSPDGPNRNSEPNLILWGDNGANFGVAVATDDINGDGYADIVIGENYNSGDGAVHFVYGPVPAESGFFPTPDIVGRPNQGDQFGSSLALGDMNGDGYSDLAVGAVHYNGGDGAFYVYSGSSSGITSGQTAGTPFASAPSGSGAQFGTGLAIGDINGDGYADLAVGIPDYNTASCPVPFTFGPDGAIALYNGSSAGLEFSSQDWINGECQVGSLFGASVAIGDLNGDGYADVAVGAPIGGPLGSAYTLLSAGPGGITVPGNVVGSPTVTITNTHGLSYGNLGYVVTLGDFHGNGYMDLALGYGGTPNGPVIVIPGGSSGLTESTVDASNPTMTATNDQEDLACGMAASGYNADGYANLIVANGNNGGAGAGGVYLLSGSSSGIANVTVDGTESFLIPGFENGSAFGCVLNQ